MDETLCECRDLSGPADCCEHGRLPGEHCKQCELKGYCACEECERDSN